MKTIGIRAYTMYLKEAIETIIEFVNMSDTDRLASVVDEEDENRKKINIAKEKFNNEQLKKRQECFFRELFANMNTYDNKSIYEYVSAFFNTLDVIASIYKEGWGFDEIHDTFLEFNSNDYLINAKEIILAGFETEYLLKLKGDIESSIDEVRDILYTDPSGDFVTIEKIRIYRESWKYEADLPTNDKKCVEEVEQIEHKNTLQTEPLSWVGQKNVLTDTFRQMKNRGYLTNSIPDVALFLKTNFDCFRDVKQSTIEGMLKNNDSAPNAIPKEEKRIKLD